LFTNQSFVVLAIALFMYVGTEVSVVKWVVTFMERDARILAAQGIGPAQLKQIADASSGAASTFFEQDPAGVGIASFALQSLSLFAIALLAGRLVSAFLLGVIRVNSFVLLTAGSVLTTIALAIAFTTSAPIVVRIGLMAAGFGMGPIFPTSVGLASVMMPRMSGTAMSLVMGIGFAGLLLIPPAVGYISTAAGGELGDVRTGLFVIIAASAMMLLLHVILVLRERRLAGLREDVLEGSEAIQAD